MLMAWTYWSISLVIPCDSLLNIFGHCTHWSTSHYYHLLSLWVFLPAFITNIFTNRISVKLRIQYTRNADFVFITFCRVFDWCYIIPFCFLLLLLFNDFMMLLSFCFTCILILRAYLWFIRLAWGICISLVMTWFVLLTPLMVLFTSLALMYRLILIFVTRDMKLNGIWCYFSNWTIISTFWWLRPWLWFFIHLDYIFIFVFNIKFSWFNCLSFLLLNLFIIYLALILLYFIINNRCKLIIDINCIIFNLPSIFIHPFFTCWNRRTLFFGILIMRLVASITSESDSIWWFIRFTCSINCASLFLNQGFIDKFLTSWWDVRRMAFFLKTLLTVVFRSFSFPWWLNLR